MIPLLFLYQDWGLLALRLALGAAAIAHGYPKLFRNFAGTAAWFDSLGFKPGKLWALVVGVAEFGGGIALAFGLGAQIAAAFIAIVMIVALAKVRLGASRFVESERMGWELELIYGASAAAIFVMGPGRFSLDYILGIRIGW